MCNTYTAYYKVCIIIYFSVTIFSNVTISSRVSESNGFLTICPNEMVLIYCAPEGTGLLWQFSSNTDNLEPASFFSSNGNQSPLQRGEHIKVWLDSNQPLRSHVEIQYSPELSDTTISCKSGNETILHLTYRLAGTIHSNDYII